MGALDRPTSGSVIVGRATTSASSTTGARTFLRRLRIGFVFQFFNLLPTLTAAENVSGPARLAGRSARESRKRAQELLERVGLGKRQQHRPDQLSGGEMQRVAIARALMMDPPLLLADEPTGNLDSTTGKVILELVRGAVEAHRTVVLVTHDPSVAARGDRVLTMADGKLVADWAPAAMSDAEGACRAVQECRTVSDSGHDANRKCPHRRASPAQRKAVARNLSRGD